MKNYLPVSFSAVIAFAFFFFLFSSAQISKAAPATHIVISEVQIEGTNDADDEFIELYNPTDSEVDLTGWRLTRKTSTGTESNLVSSMSGSISPRSFFLIAKPTTFTGPTPDVEYSATSNAIAFNNTIILYNDAGMTVIDKVGLGSAGDSEGAATENPVTGGSIERKANDNSTNDSMTTGIDVNAGNGEDNDTNSIDFVQREVSDPQNSNSSQEPVISPTPSNEPSPSVTETPSPTETPTPTISESPTPSNNPSPSVTEEPTPTEELTPTPKPSITIPNLQIVCTNKSVSFSVFGVHHNFTFPTCKLIRVN